MSSSFHKRQTAERLAAIHEKNTPAKPDQDLFILPPMPKFMRNAPGTTPKSDIMTKLEKLRVFFDEQSSISTKSYANLEQMVISQKVIMDPKLADEPVDEHKLDALRYMLTNFMLDPANLHTPINMNQVVVPIGGWRCIDRPMHEFRGNEIDELNRALEQHYGFLSISWVRLASDREFEFQGALSRERGDTLYCRFPMEAPLSLFVKQLDGYMKERERQALRRDQRNLANLIDPPFFNAPRRPEPRPLPAQERRGDVGVYDNPITEFREVYSRGHLVCRYPHTYIDEYLIYEAHSVRSMESWEQMEMYHTAFVYNKPWDAGNIYGNSEDLPTDIYDNLE